MKYLKILVTKIIKFLKVIVENILCLGMWCDRCGGDLEKAGVRGYYDIYKCKVCGKVR